MFKINIAFNANYLRPIPLIIGTTTVPAQHFKFIASNRQPYNLNVFFFYLLTKSNGGR